MIIVDYAAEAGKYY